MFLHIFFYSMLASYSMEEVFAFKIYKGTKEKIEINVGMGFISDKDF